MVDVLQKQGDNTASSRQLKEVQVEQNTQGWIKQALGSGSESAKGLTQLNTNSSPENVQGWMKPALSATLVSNERYKSWGDNSPEGNDYSANVNDNRRRVKDTINVTFSSLTRLPETPERNEVIVAYTEATMAIREIEEASSVEHRVYSPRVS